MGGWVGVGVEIIMIKAVLSSNWTGIGLDWNWAWQKCPCRNCIQCLHYPAFAAFLVWASTWLNTWFCPSIPLSVHMFQLASKKYMQRETFPIRPAMATSPFNCFFPRLCLSLCPYLCLSLWNKFLRHVVRHCMLLYSAVRLAPPTFVIFVLTFG